MDDAECAGTVPPPPPRGRTLNPGEKVAIAAVILFVFMVIFSLYMWTGSLSSDCPTVKTKNLQASILIDEEDDILQLRLEHRGGDPIDWTEYAVVVNGTRVASIPKNLETGDPDVTSTVGETACWELGYSNSTISVEMQQTVRMIHIENANVVWEKRILPVSTDL
jgi:hypothetical protein